MIGPEDFHDSLLELSTVLLGEETSHSLLQRIVDMTCAAVPGCSHVGMSLASDGAHDHDRRHERYDPATRRGPVRDGEGPCLGSGPHGGDGSRRGHLHRRIATRGLRPRRCGWASIGRSRCR